ncbi:DUF6680 family protein [Nisaea sediminum]|uniref:DUF6680 family protein n=1 Tax=Nisaea sediminum TaxID=2775867 RepID=UPI00186757A0|nr:DUF6680 family protein [Nisaea sediminum]
MEEQSAIQIVQDHISMFEVLTLLAIIFGPIMAIVVTRIVDAIREKRERRMEVFRTLMRTRRTPMYPEHVGALNLVEIEFFDQKDVVQKLRDLFAHLGGQQARSESERTDIPGLTSDQIRQRDNSYGRRLSEERERLRSKLLHSIAKSLGFNIEQLEIFEGGYSPQGWANIEDEQSLIRRWIIELAARRTGVPVDVMNFVQAPPSGQPPAGDQVTISKED